MKNIKGHQGDVIFSTINKIPEGAIKVENRPIVVSELSGHAHIVTGKVQRYQHNNRVIYELYEDSALQHVDNNNIPEGAMSSPELLPMKDHKPHVLPAGVYEFWIQQTYNPYTKLMEQVID